MSTFKDFLNETPFAGGTKDLKNKGDYPFNKSLFHTAFDDFQKDYEYKADITTEDGFTFHLYKQSNGQEWCGIITRDHHRIDRLGVGGTQTKFLKIFWINLSRCDNIANQLKRTDPTLKIKKLFNVDAVNVNKEIDDGIMSTRGIATAVYEWFVNNGYRLLGDAEQYFGARRLWAKLSRFGNGCVVHIINVKTFEIIEKNVILKRPSDFTDFDKRYYSEGTDKNDIRPILIKIN